MEFEFHFEQKWNWMLEFVQRTNFDAASVIGNGNILTQINNTISDYELV